MRKFVLAAAAFGLAFTATPAMADGHAKAEPELAKLDWYRINMIKWKSGKGRRAHEIIEMFDKVDEALGHEGVVDIHMNTGEWHSIVAIPMRQGIAAMGWANNAESDAWDAEFARQVGGEDKAKELFAEFQSLIETQERHIGHIDQ